MTRRALILAAATWLLVLGCQSKRVVDVPPDGSVTVSGRLVAVKDDRPADGGVDLTVATEAGKQEVLRVGSIFIANPRDELVALHRVVDASKIGDRLKASGRRDSSGVLMVERLERLN